MFFPEMTSNECMKFLQNVSLRLISFLITVFRERKSAISKNRELQLPVYAGKGNDVQYSSNASILPAPYG